MLFTFCESRLSSRSRTIPVVSVNQGASPRGQERLAGKKKQSQYDPFPRTHPIRFHSECFQMGSDSNTGTFTRMTEYNYFLFVSKIAKIRGRATTPGGIQELRAGAICKPSEPFELQRWGKCAIPELRD